MTYKVKSVEEQGVIVSVSESLTDFFLRCDPSGMAEGQTLKLGEQRIKVAGFTMIQGKIFFVMESLEKHP